MIHAGICLLALSFLFRLLLQTATLVESSACLVSCGLIIPDIFQTYRAWSSCHMVSASRESRMCRRVLAASGNLRLQKMQVKSSLILQGQ